jgi:ATPase subunit of ABC transporter with duplicated ATPase domains
MTTKVLTVEKADQKVTKLQQAVHMIVIKDQGSYSQAAEFLLAIKKGKEEVIAAFDPQREAAYIAYKIAMDQLNKYKNPFDVAEKQVKEKMGLYLTQQEEKRQLEEKLAQEEAEREAEKKRQELLKKANRTKNQDKKEELIEEAESVFAVAPQIASTVSNIEGVNSRFTNKPEIVDAEKLIKAIANGDLRIDIDKFISFKMSVLEQCINLTGIKNIPGVVIKKVPVISGSKGGK